MEKGNSDVTGQHKTGYRGPIAKEDVLTYFEQLAPKRGGRSAYHVMLSSLLASVIPAEKRILDAGCGHGDALNALRPSHGVGVDFSRAMIAQARATHPHLDFIVGDIEQLERQQGAFDYILLSNTVGYLQDIQKALGCLHENCQQDTRLVITHYNYLWEPVLKLAEKCGLKMREPYQNWLSIADLTNILRLEGFEVIRSRQAILLPKNVPLLSPLCNRFLSHLPFFQKLSLVEMLVARAVPRPAERALSVSVVIPARNEFGNIETLVKMVPDMGTHTEIIFVEGYSQDGTLAEIRRVARAYPHRDIKILTQDGEGKGDAVRKGFEHASGDILMILDADLSVDPADLQKFYSAVASGRAELAIGSRLVYPLQKESMRMLNLLGNKLFSALFSFLLEQRIKDTLCGTKVLLREHYRTIAQNRHYFGRLDPFGDFDLIFGAAKANLSIAEIPLRYRARTYGETQIKRFRHGLLLFRMVGIAVRKLKFVG